MVKFSVYLNRRVFVMEQVNAHKLNYLYNDMWLLVTQLSTLNLEYSVTSVILIKISKNPGLDSMMKKKTRAQLFKANDIVS